MAAPTYSARATPTGRPLKDGYQCLITFAADTDIEFWEKAVTPPAADGGDSIRQTTMHNGTWHTEAPQSLISLTGSGSRVAWVPSLYTSILALLNVETTVSILFSNGVGVSFYGYLRTFEPDEMVIGEQPEATVSIQPTNWDFANNVEAGPYVGT